MADLDFSHEDVERARRYHRPLYFAFAAATRASPVAVYSLLAWSWIGDRLWDAVDGLGWAGAAAAWAALVLVVADARPAAARRLARARARAALGLLDADRARLARRPGEGARDQRSCSAPACGSPPSGSPARCPAGGRCRRRRRSRCSTLFLAFVAPVVLEPLFNRFEPLADAQLAAELRALAERRGRAGPRRARRRREQAHDEGERVRLRARRDAPRRALGHAAPSAGEREVKLVVAHELGHRRERHVAKFTLLAMRGAVRRRRSSSGRCSARRSPRDFPLALLLFTALELARRCRS